MSVKSLIHKRLTNVYTVTGKWNERLIGVGVDKMKPVNKTVLRLFKKTKIH